MADGVVTEAVLFSPITTAPGGLPQEKLGDCKVSLGFRVSSRLVWIIPELNKLGSKKHKGAKSLNPSSAKSHSHTFGGRG